MVYKYVVFNKNGYHSDKYLDALGSIQFYSNTYSIPNQVEDWLESKYGPNWKIPDRKWHVTMDGTIENNI